MNPPRKSPCVPFALVALALVACGTPSAVIESREFLRVGNYGEAFQVLEQERLRLAEQGESMAPELSAEHAARQRDFLIERARWSIFQERMDEALADLDRVDALEPGLQIVAALRDRARLKKARSIVRLADEHLASHEYEAALAAYLDSQRIVPDYEPAKMGLEEVRKALDRMTERARSQFLEAVRKYPQFRFVEVQWHAANVLTNAPEREDAQELQDLARRENAKVTFDRAAECERQDQFGAALVLYQAAKRLDPELENADAAILRMKQELQVLVLIERAQLEMRNRKYQAANDVLAEAFEKSELSRGAISELMMQSRRREAEDHYQDALDLQVLGKKAEALAAFELLVEGWPDGLKDEAARVSSLRIDIEGAATEWAAAVAAESVGDLDAALDHYESSQRFYEDWRDAGVQVERLRALIAARKTAEPPPEGAEPGAGTESGEGH